ncbi:hypothetical protein Pst134EB_027659 [Puccinia striiformis f. sp. tritici]|nr:hypothetical protein Pst134EB_027659 [Puccinia striiformis f. sp. tritici]
MLPPYLHQSSSPPHKRSDSSAYKRSTSPLFFGSFYFRVSSYVPYNRIDTAYILFGSEFYLGDGFNQIHSLVFFLLAPGAWNFQCSDQGDKRNGICASSSSQTKTTVTDASNDPNNPTELNCNNTSDQTFCCASNAQKLNRQNNLSNNRGVDDITLCVLTVAAPRGGNTRELQKRGNTGFGSTGGGDAGFRDAGFENTGGDSFGLGNPGFGSTGLGDIGFAGTGRGDVSALSNPGPRIPEGFGLSNPGPGNAGFGSTGGVVGDFGQLSNPGLGGTRPGSTGSNTEFGGTGAREVSTLSNLGFGNTGGGEGSGLDNQGFGGGRGGKNAGPGSIGGEKFNTGQKFKKEGRFSEASTDRGNGGLRANKLGTTGGNTGGIGKGSRLLETGEERGNQGFRQNKTGVKGTNTGGLGGGRGDGRGSGRGSGGGGSGGGNRFTGDQGGF